MMSKQEVLANSNFGEPIAEDEGDSLASYFVETDNWRRVFRGDIDVIYGSKGSGKSALYSLLVDRTNDLFDQNVILVPAENPRGAPAFRDLMIDPPATEQEFVGLWKLYLLSLLAATFEDYEFRGEDAEHLHEMLAHEGLADAKSSLASKLQTAWDYVKKAIRAPESIEGGVQVDPTTQLPTGFSGKIVFREPAKEAKEQGIESVERLFYLADCVLKQNSNCTIWLMLDRLDVAFLENPNLEKNALRALFRVYLDLLGTNNIKLKIFLRTDIWSRITQEGFREASHITRHVTISWNRNSLLNLIVRRVLFNKPVLQSFNVSVEDVVVSTQAQQDFFGRVFPGQVDIGARQPSTLDWLISRTQDGTKTNAPREIIQFLNSLRAEQMRRFEIGEPDPDGEALFARAAFKDALPVVSEIRLQQTLYAEYPELRSVIEALRSQRTLQSVDSLANIWEVDSEKARSTADSLVEVGFFEERRSTSQEPRYWVPFLYRDALNMIQGSAD